MTSMDYIIDRVAVTESGCWEWQQSLNPQTGYGQIGVYPYTAHKLAFFFAHGRYPDGVTRHRCHNRACCNPEHLAEGTYRDNYYDSVEAHRKGREKLLGRAPVNRMPTTVDGVTYPSRTHAMKALGLTWVTLMRLAD